MTVVINGTSGITDVNGTAAAPAITGTDTDTGLYFGTNLLGLATNGTNALYVDSSQNVGIGTTSPSVKLHVNSASGTDIRAQTTDTTNAAAYISLVSANTYYLQSLGSASGSEIGRAHV